MDTVPEPVRRERLSLLDLLRTLTPAEWATPSLCAGWTVQDVAAHLAWAPALTLRQGLTELVRAGLRPDRLITGSAVRWSRRGPTAILDQLQQDADTDATPPAVPPAAVEVDAVVHALDIRRPLGRPHAIDPTAFGVAADFCAGARWPSSTMLGGPATARVRGLRLVASDQDWSWGQGQEVRGPGEVLLLVLTGRPVQTGELAGPGVDTLSARL